MKRYRFPALAFSILALTCGAEEVDWKKIADETDEPSYGHLIMGIRPDSQAESAGLEKGDYVVQFGEKQVRNFSPRKPREEHVVFYIKKGGKLQETTARGASRFGYYFELVSRPWLAYLRGEIGTASDELEDEIVTFLIGLQDDPPEELRQHWKAIREKGYPADEMDAVIRAVIARRLNEPVPVREAFGKVFAEFEVFPPLYFDILENLAMATNQIGVLRELYKLDPDSCIIYEDQIKFWDTLDLDPYPPQQDLLTQAKKLRGRDILAEMKTPPAQEGKSRPYALTRLRKPMGVVSPGHYRRYIGDFPEGVENVHLSFTIFPDTTGYHTRFASEFKVYLESLQRPEGDFRVSPVLARAGINDGSRTDPTFSISGGHNNTTRTFNDDAIQLGLLDVTDKKNIKRLRERGKQPQQIDLIRLNGETAVYCNGVCYSHLPVSDEVGDLRLMFHFSGMAGKVKAINVWELKAE